MRREISKLAVGSLAALVFAFGTIGLASAATADSDAPKRPRVIIHPRHFEPRPNSKRHCASWLQKEYRVSGTVITPQMRCWWD
jgi:hypothetical protein